MEENNNLEVNKIEEQQVAEISKVEENQSVVVPKEEVVDNQNNQQPNNKKNNLTMYLVVLILLIAAFCGGFFLNKIIDSDKKDNNTEKNTENNNQENNNQENNNQENNNQGNNGEDIENSLADEVIIELENIRTSLNNYVAKGYNPYIVRCLIKDIDTFTSDFEYVKVSTNSINDIINMLEKAIDYEKNTVDGVIGCPPNDISYIININPSLDGEKKFIVMYAGSSPTLVVGFNGVGYRFHYENYSDIKNFLESLS